MIAYLQGKIRNKSDKSIIIDTGNIGYYVTVTKELSSNIEDKEEIELFIHSYIKEDAFDLYGFNTESQLNFFRQLLKISGVGPKVAMEILSAPTDKIKLAIINDDEAFICKVPGIGKKTAKRIIIELK
ncbi:Holliday junction branch migration protein RuvA, partial [Candidatus Peregrinibacteria bacterium]|nr:Holliday junction branch migration protein RuvA [Candidatus Peregrinibacteria bacterium]